MTLDEAIEHGRAWVAAGWVWSPGQVAISWVEIDGQRVNTCVGVVTSVLEDGRVVGFSHIGGGHGPRAVMVPDLRDRGTLGHALGQVREAWGSPGAGAGMKRLGGQLIGGWAVSGVARGDDCASYFGFGDTEAEALLAARRLAP